MRHLLLFVIFLTLCICVSGQDIESYKIYSEKCNEENKCLILAYIDADKYNEAQMQELADQLAKKYKNKTIANVNIFDNKELIQAFLDGKRNPSQIQIDRRAYFIHSSSCGDLLFYKPKKNKIKTVKLVWKDKPECNKPIALFSLLKPRKPHFLKNPRLALQYTHSSNN